MWIDEWLFKEGILQQEFANTLGITREYLGKITSGKVRASKTLAKLIEFETNGEVTAENVLFGDMSKRKVPPKDRK